MGLVTIDVLKTVLGNWLVWDVRTGTYRVVLPSLTTKIEKEELEENPLFAGEVVESLVTDLKKLADAKLQKIEDILNE